MFDKMKIKIGGNDYLEELLNKFAKNTDDTVLPQLVEETLVPGNTPKIAKLLRKRIAGGRPFSQTEAYNSVIVYRILLNNDNTRPEFSKEVTQTKFLDSVNLALQPNADPSVRDVMEQTLAKVKEERGTEASLRDLIALYEAYLTNKDEMLRQQQYQQQQWEQQQLQNPAANAGFPTQQGYAPPPHPPQGQGQQQEYVSDPVQVTDDIVQANSIAELLRDMQGAGDEQMTKELKSQGRRTVQALERHIQYQQGGDDAETTLANLIEAHSKLHAVLNPEEVGDFSTGQVNDTQQKQVDSSQTNHVYERPSAPPPEDSSQKQGGLEGSGTSNRNQGAVTNEPNDLIALDDGIHEDRRSHNPYDSNSQAPNLYGNSPNPFADTSNRN